MTSTSNAQAWNLAHDVVVNGPNGPLTFPTAEFTRVVTSPGGRSEASPLSASELIMREVREETGLYLDIDSKP